MDFPFNLKDYVDEKITIIRTNLLPVGFHGSSERTRLCISVIGDILNKMGEASAKAQMLINPVTSAIKYKNSDHILYLMVNLSENSDKGTAVGYLKMGWKDLFIFDLNGTYTKRRCFCCLDFYIHETRQRQGFGKRLYDFMLFDNSITPDVIPIDRPSEKFIKFLQKHYNLRTIIPQPNNFILYEQFFCADMNSEKKESQFHNKKVEPFCHIDRKPRTNIKDVVTYKRFNKAEGIHR